MDVTEIVFDAWDSPSPARTSRSTGVVYLNLNVYPYLKREHQRFVIWHEQGHIVLNTSNELLADEFAFSQYAKAGLPLSESVFALSKVLSMESPEHNLRIYHQLERAKEFDYYENRNLNVYRYRKPYAFSR